jgi:methylthioribulose-1-phosphate dehydratase
LNHLERLIDAASSFHARGWMEGTAGNLSARTDHGFWITASGVAKGQLSESDFVRVGMDGTIYRSDGGRKPSAETSIHQRIYQMYPQAHWCYHVHTMASVRASLGRAVVTLPPLEMLKGFGLPDKPVDIPVLHNHAEVSRIADDLKNLADQLPAPILLISGHGLTTWAAEEQQCRNQLELADFLLRFTVEDARWRDSTS